MSILSPYDRDALKRSYQAAEPFPHMMLDNFLDPELARAAAASYLPFDEARALGREFKAVNENLKVQIVDAAKFPAPIATIASALSSQQFIDDLSFITGIDKLLWDPTYGGGGMHQTSKSGWLDVHVDFNFATEVQLFRRLNILVYLNPVWEESWGGLLELWDRDVKVRHKAVVPLLNRCVVFTTSKISYHGVTAVQCPPGMQRCSFAAYYYTRDPPADWDGTKHSTIFKARPDEFMKKNVLMPAEAARYAAQEGVRTLKKGIKSLLGRE